MITRHKNIRKDFKHTIKQTRKAINSSISCFFITFQPNPHILANIKSDNSDLHLNPKAFEISLYYETDLSL